MGMMTQTRESDGEERGGRREETNEWGDGAMEMEVLIVVIKA